MHSIVQLDYSVIIPVFRGEATLPQLYSELSTFFNSLQKNFELVLVFDNGNSKTLEVILRLQSENPGRVKVVTLTRNYGQHNAIICGFKYAQGDLIITMDEDLQHHPKDILLLINERQRKDFDVVYGKYSERKHSLFRNTTSWMIQKCLAIGIPDLHKDYSAFRIVKRNVAVATIGMNNSYTFLDGYISWITTNVSSIETPHHQSKAGKSSYSTSKLIRHSINIFITFSSLPSRFINLTSAIIFILSLLYTFYIVIRKLCFNDLVPGFATITIISGFGSGLLIFYLGIIAEYLHQINMKTTKRVPFLEKDLYL